MRLRHVELVWHGDSAQKSYRCSHRLPMKKPLHLHANELIRSTQVALFWHGELAHSFMLVSQSWPVKPRRHWHEKLEVVPDTESMH